MGHPGWGIPLDVPLTIVVGFSQPGHGEASQPAACKQVRGVDELVRLNPNFAGRWQHLPHEQRLCPHCVVAQRRYISHSLASEFHSQVAGSHAALQA